MGGGAGPDPPGDGRGGFASLRPVLEISQSLFPGEFVNRTVKIQLDPAEVLQDALDAEQSREWWSDASIPMFGQRHIAGDEPDLAEDEDAFGAAEGLIFHGLYGSIPESRTTPLRLEPRRSA